MKIKANVTSSPWSCSNLSSIPFLKFIWKSLVVEEVRLTFPTEPNTIHCTSCWWSSSKSRSSDLGREVLWTHVRLSPIYLTSRPARSRHPARDRRGSEGRFPRTFLNGQKSRKVNCVWNLGCCEETWAEVRGLQGNLVRQRKCDGGCENRRSDETLWIEWKTSVH